MRPLSHEDGTKEAELSICLLFHSPESETRKPIHSAPAGANTNGRTTNQFRTGFTWFPGEL